VFLLSSPVTILVSLWGMTTDSHLHSLRWGYPSQASLRDNLKFRDIKANNKSEDNECSTFSP
jgi:hypothetical protein